MFQNFILYWSTSKESYLADIRGSKVENQSKGGYKFYNKDKIT